MFRAGNWLQSTKLQCGSNQSYRQHVYGSITSRFAQSLRGRFSSTMLLIAFPCMVVYFSSQFGQPSVVPHDVYPGSVRLSSSRESEVEGMRQLVIRDSSFPIAQFPLTINFVHQLLDNSVPALASTRHDFCSFIRSIQMRSTPWSQRNFRFGGAPHQHLCLLPTTLRDCSLYRQSHYWNGKKSSILVQICPNLFVAYSPTWSFLVFWDVSCTTKSSLT